MKLILLGAPGAGKGTQAEIISEKLGIPTISTGQILRAAIKEGSPIGKIAKEYIDDGNLVPDDVIIGIVKERLTKNDCKNGYILDGVPRTIVQAETLEKMDVHIDTVVGIEVEDSVIEERMTGRRVCTECGETYHITALPPKTEGICNKCGGSLGIRKDDAPETVLERLKIYHNETEPLVNFYKKNGKYIEVKGESTVADTTKAVFKALEIKL